MLCIALAPALAAAPALALGSTADCEDEISEEIAIPQFEDGPVRVILPCGVAEQVLLAGDLACADANPYLVTHNGTLLCELDVPALAATTSPVLERAPAATLSSSSAFSAAGVAPAVSALVPPLVVELLGARPHVPMAPREGFVRPPAVPS